MSLHPNAVELNIQAQSLLKKAEGLHRAGQLARAKSIYENVLKIRPNSYHVFYMLGVLAFQSGDNAAAVDLFTNSVRIKPNFAEAYASCGVALHGMRRFNEAIASYDKSIAINPDYAGIYVNHGLALHDLGRLDAAIISFDKALAIKPDFAEAYSCRGNSLRDLNRLDRAIASYDKAIAIKPDFAEFHSNRLFCLAHSKSVDPRQLYLEHLAFGQLFEEPLRAKWKVHRNVKDPVRRLNIGFVSGDLRDHPVSSFLEPVLHFLAKKSTLSIHAYYNLATEDDVTRRLKRYFAHWHIVAGMSDTDLANKIRSDKIDILIDLSGHTPHNRLLTFALKPAPIQATWLGYPYTTGLTSMDYILSDQFWIPPEIAWQFTEKVVSLPAGMVFLPNAYAPPVGPLPALKNGYITFGSFNRVSKITTAVVALWSALLRSIPTARIAVGVMPPDAQDALIQSFAIESIALERLTFFARVGTLDYLALHHQIDICLDTFPYSGCTTTAQAGWMGVPTLTLAGETPPSRQSLIFMRHWGLDAFVASSNEDFVNKGIYWNEHIDKLAAIRLEMRARFNISAMGRPQAAADAMELASRNMWQRWCSALPPTAIDATKYTGA